ncbi:MAG TPA: hypothetical protein VN624_08295 [Rhodanobacter sp.]|nr:hypothetical protein [Rhodanobacter sp.]
MRKTVLSALIIGASVFTVPAFAQVNLGGAARVGAGVRVGAVAPNAMHAVGQTTAQTKRTLHRADSRTKHRARQVTGETRSTVNDHANANANTNANGAIGAGADPSHASANAKVDTAGAGLDTAATAGKAGDMGQGVGGDVRDTAHSAIQSTDRTAGSVGNAVRQTATGQSVGADVKANASANAHGHGH